MRAIAHQRLLMSAVALGSAVALTACGSSASTQVGGESIAPTDAVNTVSPSPHLTPGQAQTSALNTSQPAPESTGVAAPSAPVTVNKTITDPVSGNKAAVLKYVLGYQPSEAALQKSSALADQKVVLVQVRVTAGTKYYGTIGPEDFRLTSRNDAVATPTTTILNGELTKAGYPLLTSAHQGKSSTGWLTFTPESGVQNYILQYKRLGYRTSNGNKVKAKNFDLPLS